MSQGVANTVFVIRPATFGANPETASTNAFQRAVQVNGDDILAEFDGLAERLDAAGVRVIIGRDEPEPARPDAVFPNNWLSLHEDGRAVLYPMQSPNRRREVRSEFIDLLEHQLGVRWSERVDLSGEARQGRFLEGTGSLVLDRRRRTALVAESPRNDPRLVDAWAQRLGYDVLAFRTRGPDGHSIYHTNVLLALGPAHAVWARDWVVDEDRARLEAWFEATERESIVLDEAEAHSFAGNALALAGADPLWVLSTRAERSLRGPTRTRLEAHATLVPLAMDMIETVGGGSARCTLVEVFPPLVRA